MQTAYTYGAFGGQIVKGVGGAIIRGGGKLIGGGRGGKVLYRLVTVAEPVENLVSNAAKGLAPRGPEIANPILHEGVSMFDSLARALDKIPVLERGGKMVLGVAEVRIPASASGVAVEKTLSAGHYTVLGEPGTLMLYWFQSILR